MVSQAVESSIPEIRFPFRLVRFKSQAPVAFTCADRMEAFLKNCDKRCKVWSVNSYTIAGIMKDLVARGYQSICFDPEEDGTGGYSVAVENFPADGALTERTKADTRTA
jgi:hypothetical protein